MATLVLITDTFPFDGALEHTFIEPSLPYLVQAFDRMIVAPERLVGRQRPLPAGVMLDQTLAKALERGRFGHLVRGATSWDMDREVFGNPWLLFRWLTLARAALFISRAKITGKWAERFIAQHGLQPGSVVFCTFWLFHAAHGLSSLKRRLPELHMVSQAHGADLYEARHSPPYIPCRDRTIALLDAIYPDSAEGVAYLKAHPASRHTTVEVARLGTPDPEVRCAPSRDGILRVVSCSSLMPVKRVDMIVAGIAALARRRPDLRIDWQHFGGGEQHGIIEVAARALPPSVTWTIAGHVPAEEIIAWYRKNPVDVFINVSSSEGTPVSAMEAASFGIPIVATAVGGNREIVTAANGFQLDPEPTPAAIAETLEWFAGNPDKAAALRDGSRAVWERNYAARVNFPAFAARLRARAKG
ncbi:glycosyltransferase [Pseudorhodoplanes sp.]|jgi:glycosyltransferase involved in cell wall biosynthesis|uniref:glycosyltransferase n=1 Tax=Pseudorhodoplanes sp. TaxID=1934341 RepID=UPI002C010737|nr:glycosyltransferase [Pseudorhodoplanes sp.]HWV43459.1 glycosyltransferase [Pseudorhodoplanes sp.]